MDVTELDTKVNALLLGLPPELSVAVRERVTFYKTKMPTFKAEEIYREAGNLTRLEMLAYLDRRKYLGMYNRRFSEYKIAENVRAIVAREAQEERDLYSLVRVNFDLNGLKALNDLGGHEAGNRGLKLFANILNFGATTLWLRDELKLNVITSAEGGDEFGIVISGPIDLREKVEEIGERFAHEVYNTDASHMLDFNKPEVLENLKLLGIAESVPADFRFRISTSVGICLLGEAFDRVDVNRPEATFDEIVQDINNAMFAIADERSARHKSEFKKELAKTDPILAGLYARMSKEVIHLERRIKELEGQLKAKK